jgi:hypothetical protein
MTQDSVWHRRLNTFATLFRNVADKTTTVVEVIGRWREASYIPKPLKHMTVQQLIENPRQIEELYYDLKRCQPERHFKFPYNRKEREQELLDLLSEDYNIIVDKAHAKVVPGYAYDGTVAFTYAIEAAMAPFNDGHDNDAGEVEFIGSINSGMHIIDDGAGFFSGGLFTWHDKRGEELNANSVRGILHECGFNTNLQMSKRRFHSVLYLNLLTHIPDWSGGAGKTSIELSPYTDLIAKAVSSLAYKMPSYHGHGYSATPVYVGIRDENQIAQNYYLNFLRERYRAIQANPSLRITDRITQSGVWYRVHKIMVKNNFEPRKDWGTTRQSLTNQISEFCEELSENEWGETVTREDLGIIASSRAIMYFDGHEYPVGKDNISALANAKTTDIIVIEKEGMADALKGFADEYHIALVFTRGRFVDYVKELILAAISEDVDIKVWTLTDYDVDGMEIANAVDNTRVPRIGIDLTTVEWLQNNGYPNLKQSDVEEQHYAKDAEKRTSDEYLWTKRIELDSIHSEVGGKGLWKYILYQIKTMAKKGRDYTEIVERPEPSHLYPKAVNDLLDYLSDFFDGLIDEPYTEIEKNELEDVKGNVLKIDDTKTSIRKRLKEDTINKSKDVNLIAEEIQSLFENGNLPKPKDGYVSKAALERQKEEYERLKSEEESTDDDDEKKDDDGRDSKENDKVETDTVEAREVKVHTDTVEAREESKPKGEKETYTNPILERARKNKTFPEFLLRGEEPNIDDVFNAMFGGRKTKGRKTTEPIREIDPDTAKMVHEEAEKIRQNKVSTQRIDLEFDDVFKDLMGDLDIFAKAFTGRKTKRKKRPNLK